MMIQSSTVCQKAICRYAFLRSFALIAFRVVTNSVNNEPDKWLFVQGWSVFLDRTNPVFVACCIEVVNYQICRFIRFLISQIEPKRYMPGPRI